MLEFNGWFFVLVVNFLVLPYVLNVILYRPLLKVFKEREEGVDGALAQAKQMDEEKEKGLEEIQKSFSQVSADARAKFEELRSQGQDKQREMLEEAGKGASEHIENARATLKAEAEKARQALRADVEKFSEEIVKKLVGV